MVVVLVLCLGGITAISMQVRCVVDAAREAARLAARGDERSAVDAARRIAPVGAGSGASATATFPSLRWLCIQSCCPNWILPPKRSRRRSRCDDRGSATVVAAAMAAVLLCVTGAGDIRCRAGSTAPWAQSAARSAALAAAARLPSGVAAACADAVRVAREMQASDPRCAVDDLDVVVTVEVAVFFGGAARAAARAGPQISASSSSVGNRSETSPANVSGSTSTSHGHMHRHPIVLLTPRSRNTLLAVPSTNSFFREAITSSSSGWTRRPVRVLTAPVVERAGLVEPFQQAPVGEVDQRSVDPRLRQPAKDPMCQVVRRYHRAVEAGAPDHRPRDQVVLAVGSQFQRGAGNETDPNGVTPRVGEIPGAS